MIISLSDKIDFTTLTLGRVSITSNQSGIGATEIAITGSSITVNVPNVPSPRLKFTINAALFSYSSTTDRFVLRVRESTNLIAQWVCCGYRTDVGIGAVYFNTVAVTPGSHTYNLSLQREIGSGSITTNANSIPSEFLIELV